MSCRKGMKGNPYTVEAGIGASGLADISDFAWIDERWMSFRRRTVRRDGEGSFAFPLNVYELHLGSWRTRDGVPNGDGSACLNYREIADILAPYVRRMGYTHVELMPITEYPCVDPIGDQSTSMLGSASRLGSPHDLMYFVNALHSVGVGVILGWEPAVFTNGEKRSSELFDGRARENLVSSALLAVGEYHFDGLCIENAASMLQSCSDGGANDGAVRFLRSLNSAIAEAYPDVITVADGAAAYHGITRAVEDGGLGFGLVWNRGWTENSLEYMREDPIFRKYSHGKLTYSMVYAYSERFLLPISHDAVSGGRGAFAGIQFGNDADKLKGARAHLMYMMAHPGKKLTFMGSELAQLSEWRFDRQPDWWLCDMDEHRAFQYFVAALNEFYLKNDTLWYDDFSWDGFRWVLPDEAELNLLAFERRNGSGDRLLCVFNFSGADIPDYRLTLPGDIQGGTAGWEIVFSTESGSPRARVETVCGEAIKISLPQRSAVYLAPRRGIEI